ncbi:hypothetical protein TL16_g04844 [Triparma laevis f. inornata]|uniref:Uncharacterized protein n=1 Tax=Triparma laevis f. inornata TaxID=1714386 RepID=A0A9W7ADQ9_9STRA|nr:hypothetical protein TL16_g04844 [Triparma laevis f. inornata]
MKSRNHIFQEKELIKRIKNLEEPGGSCVTVLTGCVGTVLSVLYNKIMKGDQKVMEMMNILMSNFLQLCSTKVKSARGLVYEPLDMVIEGLEEVEGEMVGFMIECTKRLAGGVGYPEGYFLALEREYDSELEIERNDVRELVRTIGEMPNGVTAFLSHLKNDESSYHIFSALAKPISTLLKNPSINNNNNNLEVYTTALNTLESYLTSSSNILQCLTSQNPNSSPLPSASYGDSFQTLRLTCLTLTSHGVYLHPLSQLHPHHLPQITNILNIGTKFSIASTSSIREYPQTHLPINIIKQSLPSVNGEFHSPGGEDHLGCLGLNRLCTIKSPVQLLMCNYLDDIYNLHEQMCERERKGDMAGISCTGKSRRLVLQSVCKLCLRCGRLEVLESLLERRLGIINHAINSSPTTTSLYNLTESILDCSEFDAGVIELNLELITQLSRVILWGYSAGNNGVEVLREWGRVRGSFSRILSSGFRASKVDKTVFKNESVRGVVGSVEEVTKVEVLKAKETVVGRIGGGGDRVEGVFRFDVVGSTKIEPGCFIHLMAVSDVDFEFIYQFFFNVTPFVVELMCVHLSPDLILGQNREEEEEDEEYEDPRNPIIEAYMCLGVRVLEGIRNGAGGVGEGLEERVAEVVGGWVADWTISRGKVSGGPCPGEDLR